MIKHFKVWLTEIAIKAIDEKKDKARSKGDESLWKKEIWSSPRKNREIKERFTIEGEILGYKSRPSRATNSGEWLYDFVWRKFDGAGNLVSVDLVMEIEVSDMNLKGIRYDFNKLLQSDAKYKVLVFQMKAESDVEGAIDLLRNAAMAYSSRVAADFLLCGWVTSVNSFKFGEFSVGATHA